MLLISPPNFKRLRRRSCIHLVNLDSTTGMFGQSSSRCKTMDSSDWANLPKHLLDSVLERLPSHTDYLRFSVVCMPWNSIAKDNLRKWTAPILLTYSIVEETWYLCDITRDKILDLRLDLPDKRFCGFSKGWLITMDENFIVSLINPFSRIKGRNANEKSIVNLPAMNLPEPHLKMIKWSNMCDYYLFKATISADPISNAKDCVVAVIYEDLCELAFIRLEKDTTWTYIRLEGTPQCILDVVYVEDKFYVVNGVKQLYSFAVTSDQFNSQDVKLVAKDSAAGHADKVYLVELSDRKELLLVKRCMSPKRYPRSSKRGRGPRITLKTTKFEVYRLDADKCEWTEIHTLGGFALFVGDNSSIAILASNASRCFPNCIYFVNDWNRLGTYDPRDVGVYNIENKRLLSMPRHTATMMKMGFQIPIWTRANIKL